MSQSQSLEKSARNRKKSIIQRFRRALFLSYLIAILVSSLVIGLWSRHEVYATASQELSFLVDIFRSVGTFVLEDVRPEIVAQDVFHAPALSPVVATKKVSEHLLKVQPNYYVKTVSDNPLNPNNFPEPLEQEILKKFRADGDLKTLIQEGTIQGRHFLTSSRPSISKASCLECHGSIQQAPAQIVEEYGSDSGFNYADKEIVGASIVGVPLANLQAIIVRRSLTAVATMTLLFAGLFVIINKLVQHLILTPITGITEIALDISSGNLEREVKLERNDEIGELANAFELIRRSLLTATNLLYRQRQQEKNHSGEL